MHSQHIHMSLDTCMADIPTPYVGYGLVVYTPPLPLPPPPETQKHCPFIAIDILCDHSALTISQLPERINCWPLGDGKLRLG